MEADQIKSLAEKIMSDAREIRTLINRHIHEQNKNSPEITWVQNSGALDDINPCVDQLCDAIISTFKLIPTIPYRHSCFTDTVLIWAKDMSRFTKRLVEECKEELLNRKVLKYTIIEGREVWWTIRDREDTILIANDQMFWKKYHTVSALEKAVDPNSSTYNPDLCRNMTSVQRMKQDHENELKERMDYKEYRRNQKPLDIPRRKR